MVFETEPTIQKARKNYRCQWCWFEAIEKGECYARWLNITNGRKSTIKMHLECEKSRIEWFKEKEYGDEYPTPGDYRRGCFCGENKHFCNCSERISNNGK